MKKIDKILCSMPQEEKTSITVGEPIKEKKFIRRARPDNIEQVRAQNDLYMEANAEKYEEVISAVERETLSEEETEMPGRHILGTVMRTRGVKV